MVTETQRKQLLQVLSNVPANMDKVTKLMEEKLGRKVTATEVNETINKLKAVRGKG